MRKKREKVNCKDAKEGEKEGEIRKLQGHFKCKKDLIHPKMNKVFSFFIPFSLLFYLKGKDKENYLWEDRGEVVGQKGSIISCLP